MLLLAFVAFFITGRTRPIIEDLLGKRVVELVNVGSIYAIMLEAEDRVEDAVREGDPSLGASLAESEAETESLVAELHAAEIEDAEASALYDQLAADTPVVFEMMDALLVAAAADPHRGRDLSVAGSLVRLARLAFLAGSAARSPSGNAIEPPRLHCRDAQRSRSAP